MVLSLHQAPVMVFLAVALLCQWRLYRWTLQLPWIRESSRARRAASCLAALTGAWLAVPLLAAVVVPDARFSQPGWVEWLTGLSLVWVGCVTVLLLIAVLWRRMPGFDPGRRHLLRTAGAALTAAPFAVAGFGVFVQRNRFRIREIDVPVRKLPADLYGLRLVQLSDIHFGPFLEEGDLDRVVDMANETRAHLAVRLDGKWLEDE